MFKRYLSDASQYIIADSIEKSSFDNNPVITVDFLSDIINDTVIEESKGEAPSPAVSLRHQVTSSAEKAWTLSNESTNHKSGIHHDAKKRHSSVPNETKRESFKEALNQRIRNASGSPSSKASDSERDHWANERPRTREEYNETMRRQSVSVYGTFRCNSQRDISIQPLERFRRAVRQIKFLNTIKFAAEQAESTQVANSDGLHFDPHFYKAQKDIHLTNEAIFILSINPSARTEEQLNTVITSVKASVPAFGEYPVRMQRQLLSVGWYERFDANRVIIRQGHKALNFYFILSGSAIVSLMTKDRSTGVTKESTVAILSKGHSFGELALLHDTARTATVVCQSEVSLLAVSRQDFIDIFLSNEEGEEQEHVKFLRSIPFLRRMPLDECNGKLGICLCHYFRRGVVIDRDPANSEWIYIVKSGSCRVLTKVTKPRTDMIYHNSRKLPRLKQDEISSLISSGNIRLKRKKRFSLPNAQTPISSTASSSPSSLSLPSLSPLGKMRPKTHSYSNNTNSNSSNSRHPPAFLTDERRRGATPDDRILKKHSSKEELRSTNQTQMSNNRKGTYVYASKSETDLKKTEEMHKEHIMKLAEAHKKEQENKILGINNDKNNIENVFVQTDLLKPKDQFGIASLLYHDNDAAQTKSFLISNGAECVLLSKAWIKKKSTEALFRSLRTEISPFPSTKTLQQNLQDKANWENYKSELLKGIISSRV
eukprot:gene7548-8385_t